nr:uncharacterized mitochondrial protein AtMg00810-like [Tanacetum cinerariifolium]
MTLQPHFSRVKIQDPMLDHQDKIHDESSMVKHILRGRLLASFKDLEHEGGDTRSQGGIKDNNSKIKIQDHWRANDHSNEFPNVKSAFLYGTIEEEVYVCQPPGFEDPDYPDKVYKVVKVKQKKDGIFISQDKYVAEILNKFGLTERKSASTPIDTKKPLLKDFDGEDVDVHIYRSMIGSLMYLTSSRPDIMFAVCSCARFQVTPKALHLHAVKRIIRYLKGKLNLGLWYPKDSPFYLVAYSDSDYAGVSLDSKSTTGGCQFLGCRLISWQSKKQTVMATSSTKAEYVVVASCCAQVLWIQNQMPDYG